MVGSADKDLVDIKRRSKLEISFSYPLSKGSSSRVSPTSFTKKVRFMQSNTTSHKSCRVHPVLSLALLILLQQVSVTIEDEFVTASTSMSSLGFSVGSLESMDWDVIIMLQDS